MDRTSTLVILGAVLVLLTSLGAVAEPVVVVTFYMDGHLYTVGRQVNAQPSPELAAELLLHGPTSEEATVGITSAIPASAQLMSAHVDEQMKLHIDVTRGYMEAGLDDAQLERMADQWFATINQFPYVAGIIITIEGRPLTDFIQPAEIEERAPQISGPLPQGLSGRQVAVSPGHGRYWNGSGWYYARGQYCGHEEEDLRDLKLGIYLRAYLENHGAIVRMARQSDMSYGASPYDGNRPWWQMASSYWLKNAGYSCSIYANSTGDCTLGSGANESSDDVRARPLMSDYHNTDIYVSIHTNGSSGYCTGAGCPTGTETYYDASTEHAAWAAVSQQLGNSINPNIVSAINSALPEISPDWGCHGVCVKDSSGSYGEIRIPNRAATLTELGFHDTCDRDAPLMNDNFFRSVAMWGMYKGICEYFGDSPSPMYSAQYVSDDIPSTVTQGEVRTVHITFRNKGVVWSEAKAFRLGAVGDSDPFANTRQTISGEVGPNGTYTFTFNMVFTGTGNQTTDWRMVRDGFAWFGDTLTRTVYVTASGDTEPPTVPQHLRVTNATPSSISLAWDASTDNVGVFGYRVYRDGAVRGTVSGTSYIDQGLQPNTSYNYQVEAYDVAANYSGPSAVLQAVTFSGVFSDGFNGGLDNWLLDTSVANNAPVDYSTAQNHGSLPGPGSAFVSSATPGIHFMYHWLDSSTQSLTSGGYRSGVFTGWLYDTQGPVGGMRTGLRVYVYDSAGSVKTIYWIGVYNSSLSTRYIGAVLDGSWVYYDLGPRSIGWHKLGINVLPYTGSNDIQFYVDDVLAATTSQPATAANATMKRLYMGFNAGVNADHYYDDITFDSAAPAAPSGLAGAGISENAIRWSFTDNANNEIGARLYNGGTLISQREAINSTYIDETGLTPNTVYSRTVKSYAGVLESGASAAGSGCTLSIPPSTSNITCNKPAGVWHTTNPFTFTAVGGFGVGKVAYYLQVWDQQPTHTWDGSEWTWITNSTNKTAAASANPWYFHVRGVNQLEQPNGTLDLGPYYFDDTPPSQPTVTDDGATTDSTTALHASWAAADTESGVQAYQYAIGTSAGGTEVTDWADPSPPATTEVTRSGLTLTPGQIYYISVKARNTAGLWSTIGASDGITVEIPEVSITQAKAMADGANVRISGRVVSAAFAGEFYVAETDRASGIKVESGTTVSVGDTVNIQGRIQTIGGERYVVADSVTVL